MRRAVIFVDGQSLHHDLRNLGLQERDIHWTNFFGYVIPPNHEFVRAYWYHPAIVADQDWNPRLVASIHMKSSSNHSLDDFEDQARRWYMEEVERLKGIQTMVHQRIMLNFDRIEFRYVGVLKVDPFTQKRIGEKGVDVGLSVDMVTRCKLYDTAVLISGDFDYTPAIQVVKDSLRHVHVVCLLKGSPPANQNVARGLRVMADEVVAIYESEIRDPSLGLMVNPRPYGMPIEDEDSSEESTNHPI